MYIVTVYVYVVHANTSNLIMKNSGKHLSDYQVTTLNTTPKIFPNDLKHTEQLSAPIH
jgi:hypothetical protein